LVFTKRKVEALDSWGASVAVALALKFPDLVKGLLASGYYYPTARVPVVASQWRAFLNDYLGGSDSGVIGFFPVLSIFSSRSEK
jgi:pimeloyl-ACP methyl ester carboxylesterase